jgi:hypothetical protein
MTRYVVQNNLSNIISESSYYVAPNGTQYPPDYPKNGLAGLSQIAETGQPEFDPSLQAVSSTLAMVDGAYTVVWTIRDLTAGELANLELARIAEIKASQPVADDKPYRVNKVGHGIASKTPKAFAPRPAFLIQ